MVKNEFLGNVLGGSLTMHIHLLYTAFNINIYHVHCPLWHVLSVFALFVYNRVCLKNFKR